MKNALNNLGVLLFTLIPVFITICTITEERIYGRLAFCSFICLAFLAVGYYVVYYDKGDNKKDTP